MSRWVKPTCRQARLATRPNTPLTGNSVPPKSKKEMAWRFHDHPRPGTIFRLPDDLRLQRGITYTILPDGRMMQVPAMSRMMVRSAASSHDENDDQNIVKALQNILAGKKSDEYTRRAPRAADHGGRIPRGHVPMRGADAQEGLRPAIVNER